MQTCLLVRSYGHGNHIAYIFRFIQMSYSYSELAAVIDMKQVDIPQIFTFLFLHLLKQRMLPNRKIG